MTDSNKQSDGEREQSDAQKAQEELLAPVSRIDFREELKALMNEISKASRRYEHE